MICVTHRVTNRTQCRHSKVFSGVQPLQLVNEWSVYFNNVPDHMLRSQVLIESSRHTLEDLHFESDSSHYSKSNLITTVLPSLNSGTSITNWKATRCVRCITSASSHPTSSSRVIIQHPTLTLMGTWRSRKNSCSRRRGPIMIAGGSRRRGGRGRGRGRRTSRQQ
jgi:hypothetical protein